MTVKELKQELNKYPEDMEVFMAEQQSEFAYRLVNSVKKQDITFSENPYFDKKEEVQCEVVCVVLDEL